MIVLRRLFALSAILCSLSFGVSGNPRLMNERLALNAIRQIYRAEMTYARTYGSGNFSHNIVGLHSPVALIDYLLATGNKYSYHFRTEMEPQTAYSISTFKVQVYPIRYGNKHGIRSFYTDTWGQIRGSERRDGWSARPDDKVVADCSTGSVEDNERFALYSMNYVKSAQSRRLTLNGDYGSIAQLATARLIDPRLETGMLRNYSYSLTAGPTSGSQPSYRLTVTPQNYPVSGLRSFYVDETGVVRGADKNGGPADADDPPVSVWP